MSNHPIFEKKIKVSEFDADFFPSCTDKFIRPVFFIFFIHKKLRILKIFLKHAVKPNL